METLFIVLVTGAMIYIGINRVSRKIRRFGRIISPNKSRPRQVTTLSDELELPPIPSSLSIVGKAHIIDGDTIKIGRTKIRLAGIDAPEINMPWGQKSKWAMVDICKGQIITAKLDGERSFDRLVATCFLPDGRDIGAEIIKRGLALDLPHFSGGKYRHFEPEGARNKLCNGRFGHSSIHSDKYARAYKRNNR